MTVVLVGNPGVGKSLIFNHLTGVGVEIGNYPGSSVELFSG
ncbi:MAG TPA: FeoB small GTPase domain-containing protein, partial [Methanoregulaceae archaeon]|nr:FeoB small GTPase domain-containing protein [Methanoregulaceae archaeon]